MAERLPSLTSLRWFAASAVVLRHADYAFGVDAGLVGPQGAVGVSFFFILSGFVLTWAWRSVDSPRDFYRRRLARILPAYWVVLVLSVPFGVAAWRLGFAATLLQAWVPDPDVYYGGNSIAWSLSAEMFFYALFPFLIRRMGVLGRPELARLLVGVLLAAIAIPVLIRPSQDGTGLGFWLIYICPALRLAEFVAGICLCSLILLGVRLRVPRAVAVAIALVAYLVAGQVPIYLMWVATTIIPFSILIFSCAEADIEGRAGWLGSGLLVRLGQWSYGFYLVHVLVILAVLEVEERMASLPPSVGVLVGYLLATVAASVLFHLIERPFEHRLRADRSSRIRPNFSLH